MRAKGGAPMRVKTVKAWAVIAPWGEYVEHFPSWRTPQLFKSRAEARQFRHNHSGKERVIQVEIREVRKKKGVRG